MKKLYIVTKQEFNSLYRFGQIPLINSKVIDSSNKSSLEIEQLIYNAFLNLPYFIGDEEYLIIGFENILTDNIWLEIENVSEVIPLTRAAKHSIQMKFDSRLNFKDAKFENVIHRVEEYIDIQERIRGAKAFWSLCRVDSNFENLVSIEWITQSYYNKIEGRKSNEFKSDFLVHLLSYDRYEFFPNSDLGYFYDIGEIFAHSKGRNSFVGSKFYSFLENNKNTLVNFDLITIAQIISESEAIIEFTSHLTSNDVKVYIASALFLKFKNDLAERETIKNSETGRIIVEVRKGNNLIRELNLAICLTGTFFGYQKFYDDLYDLVDLKIFKESIKSSARTFKIDYPPLSNNNQSELLSGAENDFKLKEEHSEGDKNIHDKLEIKNPSESEIETSQIESKDELNPPVIEPIQLGSEVETDSLVIETEEPKSQIEIDSSLIESNRIVPIVHQNEILENQLELKSEENISNEKESIPTQGNDKEFTPEERTILELLFKFIDEEKGVFELKSERLNDVKNAISIAFPEKNNLKKDDIIQFIKQSFSLQIKIETKSNKSLVTRNTKTELFNDY